MSAEHKSWTSAGGSKVSHFGLIPASTLFTVYLKVLDSMHDSTGPSISNIAENGTELPQLAAVLH